MIANQRIGLIAGWGEYPRLVAEAIRARGGSVYCLAVKDHADPALADLCDEFCWIGVAKLGTAIRFCRRHGVRQATMAGKIHKTLIYQPWLAVRHLPDWRFLRAFWHHFVSRSRDKKDDSLLGAYVRALDDAGVKVLPATDFAPQLLVTCGQFTSRGPTAAEQADIEFGWRLAKEMGRLDVGQSVAVKDLAVLAVEAIEGTDACIRRAGELCRKGGFTVVKVAKPQQDMRFDVPTIGLGTLETMVAAGARVLAVEADKTIVLRGDDVAQFADRHRLVVVAIRAGEAGRDAEAA